MIAWLVAVIAVPDSEVYGPQGTTTLGCECKGECEADLRFGCAVKPVCSVKSKDCALGTAQWSLSKGRYDFCEFPTYEPYEAKTAAEKQAILLGKLAQSGPSGKYPNPLGIFGESVSVSFDASADVFPMKRTKYIHSVGVVGGIEFKSTSQKYGGLFSAGAAHGLIRFSSAKAPGTDFTPGAGIKLFRDGRPSANFVAMPSLDGQSCSESNFFAKPFTNHIPNTGDFALKLVAAKFWQASYCPLMVGLSDLADGGDFPFTVSLVAPEELNVGGFCGNYSQGLANLEQLPVGTTLFRVYAAESPDAFGRKEQIGEIKLTHPLRTGAFGDEQLFFRHQYMEEDFAKKEGWLDQLGDKKAQCGMKGVTTQPPSPDKGCSSPFGGSPNVVV